MFVKVAFCILLIIGVTAYFYLSRFIYGLFPSMCARKLSNSDIDAIKKGGIIHKTTLRGKEGILASRTIKGRIGGGAYSNQFRKSSFFFIYDYLESKHERYNDSSKYEYIIKICNITDEQIKAMKIRKYDKVLIVCGDFVIRDENTISVEKVIGTKLQKKKRILISGIKSLFTLSTLYQMVSAVIAAVILWFIFNNM